MNRLRIFQYMRNGIVLFLMPVFFLGMFVFFPQGLIAAGLNADPPSDVIKLIFIHHSCGENWLADNNGRLARELQKNNYFVSDTNYGWGPDAIGDRTDIENWSQWFSGPDSRRYLAALFQENERHSPYERTLIDPSGENRIIMFKSCFPNSNLAGNPDDPPQRSQGLTVANAKAVYNELLPYFSTRPDKLFIAVTAPPLQDGAQARNARAFNQWLVRDWLREYPGNNVAVFDFYNVLTGHKNHHRYHKGQIQYITDRGRDTLAYPSGPGDDHPNMQGNRAATVEFVPLLNVYVNKWLETAPPVVQIPAEPVDMPAVEPVTPAIAVVPDFKDGVIDDFESGDLDWQVFLDGSPETRLTGARDRTRARNGHSSLKIDYQVAKDGWAMYRPGVSVSSGLEPLWRTGDLRSGRKA